MRQEIAQFDIVNLSAIGLDRPTIAALLNISRIVGKSTVGVTVPEVAADTEANTVTLTSLQLVVAAVQALVAIIEANSVELPAPDHALAARIDQMQADLERAITDNRRLARALEEMAADSQQIGIENNKLSRRVADLENGVN